MDETSFFLFVIVAMLWLIVIPFVGAIIGRPKGRGVLGFFLGFLLGPIGLIIIAIVGPTEEQKRLDARKAAHATLGTSTTNSTEGDGHSNCKKCAQPLTRNICGVCGASNPEYKSSTVNPESNSTASTSTLLKPRSKSNGFAIPAIIFSVLAIFQALIGWIMVYLFGGWAAGFGGAFSFTSVAIFIGLAGFIVGLMSLVKKDKSRVLAITLAGTGLLLASSLLLI